MLAYMRKKFVDILLKTLPVKGCRVFDPSFFERDFPITAGFLFSESHLKTIKGPLLLANTIFLARFIRILPAYSEQAEWT